MKQYVQWRQHKKFLCNNCSIIFCSGPRDVSWTMQCSPISFRSEKWKGNTRPVPVFHCSMIPENSNAPLSRLSRTCYRYNAVVIRYVDGQSLTYHDACTPSGAITDLVITILLQLNAIPWDLSFLEIQTELTILNSYVRVVDRSGWSITVFSTEQIRKEHRWWNLITGQVVWTINTRCKNPN